MTMSDKTTLGSWKIPSSLGIGVDYYYKDILRPSQADAERGASYTQNFIREHIARCDARMLPQFKSIYDEGQISRKTDRPQISWNGLFGILEDGGVSKDIIAQMEFKPHIAKDLKLMDARIFRDEPMGIKAEIMAKNGK